MNEDNLNMEIRKFLKKVGITSQRVIEDSILKANNEGLVKIGDEISLEMTLNISADVSVKVYNLTGQLVDVIAEGNFASGNYSWNWNAENLASGAYFISTQVGNEISQQKVMLIK